MSSRPIFATLLLFPLLTSPVSAEQVMSGQVLDAQGLPIPNVFVRQEGAIVAGFTDANGRFSLMLAPEGAPFLVFSAEGYQLDRQPLESARSISLKKVATYLPQYRPLLATLPKSQSLPPLDTQFQLAYQAGSFASMFDGNRLSGMLDNQLALSGQIRHDAWLLGGNFERFKTSLTLPALPPADTTALAPEESTYRIRLGYALGLSSWEIAPSLSFLNGNVTSANLPMSGTPYDYEHDRRGLGLEVPFAWALSDRLDLLGTLAYYPAISVNISRSPYALGDMTLREGSIGLGYAVTPSLRLDARYRHQDWGGDHAIDRDDVLLGLSYRPQRIRP